MQTTIWSSEIHLHDIDGELFQSNSYRDWVEHHQSTTRTILPYTHQVSSLTISQHGWIRIPNSVFIFAIKWHKQMKRKTFFHETNKLFVVKTGTINLKSVLGTASPLTRRLLTIWTSWLDWELLTDLVLSHWITELEQINTITCLLTYFYTWSKHHLETHRFSSII